MVILMNEWRCVDIQSQGIACGEQENKIYQCQLHLHLYNFW